MPDKKNVFVMGLDEPNRRALESTRHAKRCAFHSLLPYERLVHVDKYSIQTMLDDARRQLDAFDGSVDALITQWDFPMTTMVPLLCRERGLRAPSLESTLKCSHKYWSRLEQRRSIPEHTPHFCAVNPFDEGPFARLQLDLPFWLKPVKSFGSKLGFKVETREQFELALAEIREKIGKIGEPFNELLQHAELPAEVREVGGFWCIAEELIDGRELAPEGSRQNGHTRVHGVIDLALGGPHGKSIEELRLPSLVPEHVQERAIHAAQTFLEYIDFDDGCFGVEFFWNEKTDRLMVVEVNPRISQSHGYIFEMTRGQSNHEVAVSVALGEPSQLSFDEGEYEVASKFWLRDYEHEENTVVTRVPTDEDLRRVSERFPCARVSILVEEGQRLGTLPDQDSYSWLLAEIKLASDNRARLCENYAAVTAMLPFELDHQRLQLDATCRQLGNANVG